MPFLENRSIILGQGEYLLKMVRFKKSFFLNRLKCHADEYDEKYIPVLPLFSSKFAIIYFLTLKIAYFSKKPHFGPEFSKYLYFWLNFQNLQ